MRQLPILFLLLALCVPALARQQFAPNPAEEKCNRHIAAAQGFVAKNDYRNGLDEYLEALRITEAHHLPERKAVILNNIAVLYIGMHDPKNLPNTKKGLDYAAQAIDAIKKLKVTDSIDTYTSLGTAYINYGDLLNSYGTDSGQKKFQYQAIEVFNQAITMLDRAGDKPLQCQIYANLAYVYKNLGQKGNYYKYLLKSYDIMMAYRDKVTPYVQEGVHFALGEYYAGEGNYSRAQTHLDAAERLLAADPEKDYQVMVLVKGLGRDVYKGLGDYTNAYNYQTAYWNLKDSLLNAETLQKFEEMEVKYQSERKGRQLKQAALELENAHLMRNAVIVVAALLALSLFLFYRSYTAKNRALLFKKEAADLSLQKAEVEIQANREMLERYTNSLLEKTHLVDTLEQQLVATGRIDDDALSRLSTSRILTREDWAEYKRLFERVYPGFFIKIRQKYPDITDADERILAFSKLNISLKESADILGISYDSMKNSRYRLRKKMGMDTDTDFRDITAEI